MIGSGAIPPKGRGHEEILAELAVNDTATFNALVAVAKDNQPAAA